MVRQSVIAQHARGAFVDLFGQLFHPLPGDEKCGRDDQCDRGAE